MTKSDDSWSGKPRKITELERGDHHHLTEGDECYFVGEYTPRAGFAHSATNQLISNLKKKPSTRGTFQWKYKVQAIGDAAAALASSLNPASLVRAYLCRYRLPSCQTTLNMTTGWLRFAGLSIPRLTFSS